MEEAVGGSEEGGGGIEGRDGAERKGTDGFGGVRGKAPESGGGKVEEKGISNEVSESSCACACESICESGKCGMGRGKFGRGIWERFIDGTEKGGGSCDCDSCA